MSNYFSLITDKGFAKLNKAQATNKSLNLTTIAVGDSNGNNNQVPSSGQLKLTNEVYRAQINRLFQDDKDKNILIAELIIPSNVGGFVIREAGVFDEDGDLFAIGRYPATVKPKLSEGVAREEVLQMALVHQNSKLIELNIDPSIVMASRGFVDDKFIKHKQTPNPHNQYALKNELTLDKQVLKVGENRALKSLNDAWQLVQNKLLEYDVVIQIDNGIYEIEQSINLNDGSLNKSISIIGNTKDLEKVIFKPSADFSGAILNINNVNNLSLAGFTIRGFDNKKDCAILIKNSNVKIKENTIAIENFNHGLLVKNNSNVSAKKITVKNCLVSVIATKASSLNVESSIISGAARNLNFNHAICAGVYASYNSIIYCQNISINNTGAALYASSNSQLHADNVLIYNCVNGAKISYQSFISAPNSNVSNCDIAFSISNNSNASCTNSTINNCFHGFFAYDFSTIDARETKSKASNCKYIYSPGFIGGNNSSYVKGN